MRKESACPITGRLVILTSNTGAVRGVEPEEKKTAVPDEPPVLPCPCPRCGGRMIIIEVFARGGEPKYRPTPAPTPFRIDTS